MVEKGWTDKSFGDCKKMAGTNSSCQCVCHSRANLSASATAADPPAVVDLTVSPCKESTLPPPAAAAAGQSMLLLAAATELGWTRFLFLINKALVQPLPSNFLAVFRAFIWGNPVQKTFSGLPTVAEVPGVPKGYAWGRWWFPARQKTPSHSRTKGTLSCIPKLNSPHKILKWMYNNNSTFTL